MDSMKAMEEWMASSGIKAETWRKHETYGVMWRRTGDMQIMQGQGHAPAILFCLGPINNPK